MIYYAHALQLIGRSLPPNSHLAIDSSVSWKRKFAAASTTFHGNQFFTSFRLTKYVRLVIDYELLQKGESSNESLQRTTIVSYCKTL